MAKAFNVRTGEEYASDKFDGEMMRCVICSKKQFSHPKVKSDWRYIELGSKKGYFCPDEFPKDGAPKEEFEMAYRRAVRWLQNKP